MGFLVMFLALNTFWASCFVCTLFALGVKAGMLPPETCELCVYVLAEAS